LDPRPHANQVNCKLVVSHQVGTFNFGQKFLGSRIRVCCHSSSSEREQLRVL
jgi:hypothetical protein|tara:strand:- start:26463 stop:26618 length:156 start_codon:yes stop_codon:yes gene_type:complete